MQARVIKLHTCRSSDAGPGLLVCRRCGTSYLRMRCAFCNDTADTHAREGKCLTTPRSFATDYLYGPDDGLDQEVDCVSGK